MLAVLELSVGLPSPPASLRRLPSSGHLAVLRPPPPTLPPAQWGTSSRRPRCILQCGRTAAPLLHHSPLLVLRLTRTTLPWRHGPHSSWRTSSCVTAPSTTSMRSGSTASPSSSVPQGALRRRPTLCLPLNQPRATGLMACLHRLNPKTVPWHQDVRLRGVIDRARRPRVKKEAANKSRGREKLRRRSPCHLVKTACRLQWRSADLAKTKLHLRSGPRRPRPAAASSPPNCVASPGQASSSQIYLLDTTAPPTPQSSCSSMC